jgi:nucleotide-binding universal stress UspA family protein
MFRLILVPLDGSSVGERALEPATFLARQSNARIRLVRVCAAASVIDYAAEGTLRDALRVEDWTTCGKYLDQVASRLGLGQGLETAVLEEGSPAARILDDAEKNGVDLIVLTSHGRSGLTRFLLGSVTEQITRHARCPVMVVGREALREKEEG